MRGTRRSMSGSGRRTALRALLGGALVLALGGPAMAGGVVAPMPVVAGPGVRFLDAWVANDDLVIAWTAPEDGLDLLRATTAPNGSDLFTPQHVVRGGTSVPAAAAADCAGYAAIAYVADGRVSAAFRTAVGSGAWESFGVTFADPPARGPAIACVAGDRPVVAWVEVDGGTRRVRVADLGHAAAYITPPSPPDPEPLLAGTTAPGRVPSVAGTVTGAWVAWAGGNRVRLARYTAEVDGPGGLVALGTAVLGRGTARAPIGSPVVAADGARVVVAWGSCGSVRARISTDAGASFGPVRTIRGARCGSAARATLRSVAIDGRRIAIGYGWAGNRPGLYAATSRSGFARGAAQTRLVPLASGAGRTDAVVGIAVAGTADADLYIVYGRPGAVLLRTGTTPAW